ncbi:DNA cytosine methyltransferase [Streptosporangium sp. V21-05]|uniref:DNA cytosine methyltransferase n=1 Tax=Streptosporangium sp. V21-05 TaxID=3446115 RepID=UPI003F52EEDF
MRRRFRSLEICAGAGGQALGLERAGFDPVMLVDNDAHACATLRANRAEWRVLEADLKDFVGTEHDGVADVDLLSGGIPSTPFSIAGRQHGTKDDRDLLRTAIFLVMDVRPRAIMIASAANLLTSPKFGPARSFVEEELRDLGYHWEWRVLDAQHFGVPQTRKSGLLIAMRPDDFARFVWPLGDEGAPPLGMALRESMASRGWKGVDAWVQIADQVAPTIVGGSKNHGGADLGPTRSKRSWIEVGVDGRSLADEAPDSEFMLAPELGQDGLPKLTLSQVSKLQGFPDDWIITGRKTAGYRQVAQAMPPPVATAVGRQIAAALGD